MKKLISNTSFGDYLRTKNIPDYEYRYLRDKFDDFLKQPLELWMFIPCDTDGNVLEEPKDDELCKYCSYDESKRGASAFSLGCEGSRCDSAADDFMDIFEEAKDRVLFEGFEIRKGKAIHLIEFWREGGFLFTYNSSTDNFLIIGSTVEHMIKYNLELTSTALKQIGYENN